MTAAGPSGAPLEEFLAEPANCTLDLSTAVAHCAKSLGLRHAVAYLADLQQRHLVPLTDVAPTLPIDSSLAGWCYRTQSLRAEESDRDGMTAWFPLLEGAERLGVLAVHTQVLTSESLRQCRALAALLAMMISSKRAYKDSVARRTRTARMQLPAEMLRAFLPPRTIGNGNVVSTAVLEPAYDIGGDALHAVVLDAMGAQPALGVDQRGRPRGLPRRAAHRRRSGHARGQRGRGARPWTRWSARPTRRWVCAPCSPRGTAGCTRRGSGPATGCCSPPTV
ncbi:hypothetical protein ACF1AB_37480 [Streptomyces sp. NPDC014846]|uniref:hypothetical protein n=1 Tax=Streptomyces sp. NPDC014846 TaxID=3364922 RepID=UPI0036FC0EBA